MECFGAVYIGTIECEFVTHIVGFVLVIECFAKETSESVQSEAKSAEKNLCFHILYCFIVYYSFCFFDNAKIW